MVEDSGTAIRPEAAKPVNAPEPVTVAEDAAGLPVAVKKPRRQPVADITDRWRIDDEWWRREPVSRDYYVVVLQTGLRMTLYKDLTTGNWYWHRHNSREVSHGKR